MTTVAQIEKGGRVRKKYRAGFVAILGRPNAGKSTLLNALLGTKLAIIAAKPQTTRTSIQGVRSVPGAQMVFIDTPGIHKSDTLLNRRMMDTVRAAAASPDVVLFVIDVLTPPTAEDQQALDLAKKAGVPVIAVLNKVDWLDDKPKLLKLIEQYREWHDFTAYVPVSARRGDGTEELCEEIVKHLPVGKALFPEEHLTDQPERFLAAEMIREKVLHHTDKEVPHAVAVAIEGWEETPKLLRIAATIFVEKPGQKAILIGAGGSMLKKIGTLARQDMERAFGRKIFLETFVKVRSNWREDPGFLAVTDWRA
jgi:GTP-binding protein Era